MFPYKSKLSVPAICLLLLSFVAPCHSVAQTAAAESSSTNADVAQSVPGQAGQVPKPGELGSPFSADHFWNHLAMELSGGYSPVVQKGTGYFDKGFNVTGGVIDRFSPRWMLLAELKFFRLSGTMSSGGQATTNSNVVVAFNLDAAYDLLPRSSTSPYLIGGAGYYNLPSEVQCTAGTCSPQTGQNNTNVAGYNGGFGIRHKLYADKQMEIFAEGRYHYIASGSSAFGQISLFPISAGIRW